MMKRAIHFVGFKGEEYNAARRVFGTPDFIHRFADDRLFHGGELHPGDVVVFANGEDENRSRRIFSFNDSEAVNHAIKKSD